MATSSSHLDRWHDSSSFHTHRWPSSDLTAPPRALLILLHGFAEHVERYDHVWPTFNAAGIEVYGYDQRGYGLTAKAATEVKGGNEYGNTTIGEALTDVAFALRMERSRLDETWSGKTKVPIYLYGHSMGGGLALTFLTLPHLASTDITSALPLVDGVIASSPWITLTNPPDPISRIAAPLVLRLLPNFPHNQVLDASQLSHDPAVGAAYTSDPLISGKVKMKTILGSLVTGPKLLSEGVKSWPAGKPLLVTHGREDQITSAKGSEDFVEGVKKYCSKGDAGLDVEWKGWDDLFHEGHNELPPARDAFLAYTVEWIIKHTPRNDPGLDSKHRSNL